jgi:CubicO group peptidase (beta-lactamase class C family)
MSKARSQGFSPDRLQRIDRFLQERYVGPARFSGVQLLIARRGELVHQSVLGLADVERGVPLTEDAVFRIYSMTKPVTSVAFMSLWEEGLVALDDPVSRFIPHWAGMEVFEAGTDAGFLTRPAGRPMQVVDLLRHTSGLTYGLQQRTNVDAAYRKLGLDDVHGARDLAGFVDALATLPLEFSPGEAWNYSVSTDVLGHLVEVIAGKPLDQVLRERVFDPLKMTETGFTVRPDQADRFTACYAATAGGGLKLADDSRDSPFLKAPLLLSGGGGLVSTAADYLRFTHMLLNGGELDGARILAPSTLRLMTRNHLPGGQDLTQLSRSLFSESTNAGIGFGLGFAVVFDPPRTLVPSSLGEFHWGGAASTAFWVDPVEEVAVVFMTQLLPSSSYPVRRELRTLVYSALMEPNG